MLQYLYILDIKAPDKYPKSNKQAALKLLS